MGALDFKEIAASNSGHERDSFELFAREFLENQGFKIVDGPDRGPDKGRDLIAEEMRSGPGGNTTIRWLVSCKHSAHGGRSIGTADESNLRDRIELHKCSGFIGVYSTIPSSGLSASLSALKSRFELLVYDSAQLERHLLSAKGKIIAARFMPRSFGNWARNLQFISTHPTDQPKQLSDKFFLRHPHTSLAEGLKEGRERNLPTFIVIYDSAHPLQSKLDFALGYFMEYQTTKQLVDRHFVTVVGPSSDPELAALVPQDDPLELCLWVVLAPDGRIIRRESVYANPDEGMKRVRSVIASNL